MIEPPPILKPLGRTARQRKYAAWYLRALYESGHSVQDLARFAGLSWHDVAGLLHLVGTTLRSEERPPLVLIQTVNPTKEKTG